MRLRVITPVHIGDGESIIPWSYSVEGSLLKVYDLEEVIKELTKVLRGEKLRNTLLNLKNDIRVHGFSKNLGEFLAERKISLKEAYSLRVQASPKVRDIYKYIKSFIKSRRKVFIPGSEVKGTLRTVFMFGVIQEELKKGNSWLYEEIRRILIENLSKPYLSPRKRWSLAEIKIEDLILRNGKNNTQEDLFKALLVSDSELLEPSECLFVDGVKLVNSRRRFFELHELLKEGTTFNINIEIDEQKKGNIKNPFTQYLTLERLKEFSLNFYSSLLERIKLFSRRNNIYIKALDELERLIKEERFILRIGKHQGFLSVGILGILLENGDEDLYRKVYRTAVPRFSGIPNKTLKLTGEGKLLGWVVLE